MKKLSVYLMAISLIMMNMPVYAASRFKAEVDKATYTYAPTQLENGDFEKYPDKGETSGTGGSDWQTTEGTPQVNSGKNGYFEWIDPTVATGYKNTYGLTTANGCFIEMNSVNPAVLYQNLKTNPGDVILWKLSHAPRNNNITGNDVQEMQVQIGENNPSLQPAGTNPNITKNLAKYTAGGITNSDGNNGFLAKDISDLAALKVNKLNPWNTVTNPWKTAKAIYTIPEGQTSTRFAFTSITPGSTGNFLDDIVFETLLGDLKIDTSSDNGIKITGYWAPIEENQDIDIEYIIRNANTDLIVENGTIDMSALKGDVAKNIAPSERFKININYDNIPNGDYVIEVNHALFKSAKIRQEFKVTNSPKSKVATTVTTKNQESVPETYDGIGIYVVLFSISLISLLVLIKLKTKVE